MDRVMVGGGSGTGISVGAVTHNPQNINSFGIGSLLGLAVGLGVRLVISTQQKRVATEES